MSVEIPVEAHDYADQTLILFTQYLFSDKLDEQPSIDTLLVLLGRVTFHLIHAQSSNDIHSQAFLILQLF